MRKLTKEQVKTIRRLYGEAFYALDTRQFSSNFLELKKEFSNIYSNFNIAYSYKTNYIPSLCKIVKKLGGYAEVVSEMEMELALRIGVDPSKIIWNGPVKNENAVTSFLLLGGIVNLDSHDDLAAIKRIISDYPSKKFKLGIRVNYDVGDGVISRFGFDVNAKEFEECLNYIVSTKNVEFASLQCHFAKRNACFWPARAKGMADLIKRIGVVPKIIDLGGGIYGKMPGSLKAQFSERIDEYSCYAETVKVFAQMFADRGPELIIEPGSALVGDCMQFLGTVKTIKSIRGKWFASVLGSQKNISMSSVNPPVEVIHMGNKLQYFNNIDFVGFTCIEGDILYKNYCGDLALDDVIVISNCGSYSIVLKPPFILPNFPIIDISSDRFKLIKKAESFDDVFHTYVF